MRTPAVKCSTRNSSHKYPLVPQSVLTKGVGLACPGRAVAILAAACPFESIRSTTGISVGRDSKNGENQIRRQEKRTPMVKL